MINLTKTFVVLFLLPVAVTSYHHPMPFITKVHFNRSEAEYIRVKGILTKHVIVALTTSRSLNDSDVKLAVTVDAEANYINLTSTGCDEGVQTTGVDFLKDIDLRIYLDPSESSTAIAIFLQFWTKTILSINCTSDVLAVAKYLFVNGTDFEFKNFAVWRMPKYGEEFPTGGLPVNHSIYLHFVPIKNTFTFEFGDNLTTALYMQFRGPDTTHSNDIRKLVLNCGSFEREQKGTVPWEPTSLGEAAELVIRHEPLYYTFEWNGRPLTDVLANYTVSEACLKPEQIKYFRYYTLNIGKGGVIIYAFNIFQ